MPRAGFDALNEKARAAGEKTRVGRLMRLIEPLTKFQQHVGGAVSGTVEEALMEISLAGV